MSTASRRRCGDISTLLSETISIRSIAISRRTKIHLHHKLAKRWRGDEWHGKGKRRLHGRGRDHDLRARDSRQRLHVAAPAAGRCVVREPHGQRADRRGDHRGPHPASALDPARGRHHPGHRERVPGQVGRRSVMAGGSQEGGQPALAFHFGPSTVRRIEDAVFFGWMAVIGLVMAFGTYIFGSLLRTSAFIPLKFVSAGLIIAGLISIGLAMVYLYGRETET